MDSRARASLIVAAFFEQVERATIRGLSSEETVTALTNIAEIHEANGISEATRELRAERDRLKEAARGLIAKLPRCSQRWWTDPRGDKTPPDAWACHKLATNVFVGADGDESYYCDEHFQHEYVSWAEPLRVLSKLVEE